jgi:hypothetical protein
MAKTTKGRVKLPRNPVELLTLAQKVYDIHTALGTNSKLLNLEDQDWSVTGSKVKVCLSHHLKAEDLKRQMEEEYRLRDLDIQEISDIVGDSRDLLKGVFSKTPKRLGEYGFDVDDTPPVKKAPKKNP